MVRIKAYYADWVRGPLGDAAGKADNQKNVELACMRYNYLRNLLGWYIYCPHEHEDVVSAGWKTAVSSDQILNLCCAVVLCCDIFIVGGDPKYSSGVRTEMTVAEKGGLVIWQAWPLLERVEYLANHEEKILSAARQTEADARNAKSYQVV